MNDNPLIAGMESAVRLQQVFIAMSDTKAARNLHNYASTLIDLCQLREQIASAISRGHLQANFYSQLKEWTK